MLVMSVGSMAEHESFATRLFRENPRVKRFRTIVVMGRLEVGLEVPLTDYQAMG